MKFNAIVSACIILNASLVFATESEGDRKFDDDQGILTLVWENDIFAGTHPGYTNCARAS